MRSSLRGLSLLECLLACSLMVLIFAGTLELSRLSKGLFFRLKESQEFNQEVSAGLDRIRRDIINAGSGLFDCLALGLISGLQAEDAGLVILSREAAWPLSVNVEAGSQIIPVAQADSFSRGQLVAFVEGEKGEIALVDKVEKTRLLLAQSLRYSYQRALTKLIAIEKIRYYLDPKSRILRRQVNASPAQPLLAEVVAFNWMIAKASLAKITVVISREKEVSYEIKAVAKNIILAQKIFP